ncbi:hypothetical protein TNCV_4438671 [Trichonephila clavipes]|nr:hypothetical protein TNCV_4438671 [Trichonephila clavipes]
MKEGLIALNYECSKCNERMGLYERKSAVLDGDFEWVCSTITSQNIYGRTPMILLTMRPSRLFVKIRCHAVASTRKRSAVRNVDELNLDQAPQDINKEKFQLERVCLQAFVAATDPGCKKKKKKKKKEKNSLGHILEIDGWDCEQFIHFGSRLQYEEACPTDGHLEHTS